MSGCSGTEQTTCYAIRVSGHLDTRWCEWFDGLTVTHLPCGDSILCGPVQDQAALHGLLSRLGDLNLTLVAVNKVAAE